MHGRLVSTLVAACLLLPAGDAIAGTYTVHGCRGPSGQPGAPSGDAQYGWQAGSTASNYRTIDQCSSDFGSAFLAAEATGAYSMPFGTHAVWTFVAPPATAVHDFRVWWAGSTASELGGAAAKARLDWGADALEYNHTPFGNPLSAFDPVNLVEREALDEPSFYAFVACNRPDGCTGDGNASHRIAWFRIYKSEVGLRDVTPPSGSASGGSLAELVWAGSESFGVSGSDAGGGVYRVLVDVDGEVVHPSTIDSGEGRCADADPGDGDPYEFVDVRPCPAQASGEVLLNTTAIADGEHTVKIWVEDAAGNRALAAGPLSRTVDNVPPPINLRRPAIAGAAQVGSGLAADHGDWAGEGVTHDFAWQRCEADGATCTDIPDASARTYRVSMADVGKRMRVRVRASNREGSTDAYSAAGDPVAGPADPPAVNDTRGQTGGPVSGDPNGEHATPLATLTAHESGTDRRTIRVRYGRRVTITGRLLAPGGIPIAGARLEVASQTRVAGSPVMALPEVVTDRLGAFRYIAGPGPSRVLRIGYRARIGDLSYARTTEVHLRVVARVTFRLGRRALRNGQTLRYLGRVLGPGTGRRFVEVQVRVGRRWVVVCSVRSDARGSFGCAHRFTRTFKRTTYRFRARVRRQPGLPYETGVSATRKITVRP